MLLFDVSPGFFNCIIHESFGNFEVLGIHNNPVTRRAYVCYASACPALIALGIRKSVFYYLNAILLFDVISIIPLISTTGLGILLLAPTILFFISGGISIFSMASKPFLDTAS